MIRVTAKQADAIEWALEVMEEYWDDEADEADPEQVVPRPVALPRLTGRTVDIADVHGSVLHDLRYRIVDQLGDIQDDNMQRNTAGENAWLRVRDAASDQQRAEMNASLEAARATWPKS